MKDFKYIPDKDRYQPKLKTRTDGYYEKREKELLNTPECELVDEFNDKLHKLNKFLREREKMNHLDFKKEYFIKKNGPTKGRIMYEKYFKKLMKEGKKKNNNNGTK